LSFLENNNFDFSDRYNIFKGNETTTKGKAHLDKPDRAVSVLNSLKNGMNEKTIIRTDRKFNEKFTKHNVTSDKRETGDRAANVMQSISAGMTEKSIIREIREHYNSIHPTQKPIRLLERILSLVTKNEDIVLDPFGGSFSTMEAVYNLGLNGISYEIDREYFSEGQKRINKILAQQKLF